MDKAKEAIEAYPKVVLAFSIFMFIFFACNLASIEQCNKNCPSTDQNLNRFNYFTTTCGLIMTFVLAIYTGVTHRDKIFSRPRTFGRRFGRR